MSISGDREVLGSHATAAVAKRHPPDDGTNRRPQCACIHEFARTETLRIAHPIKKFKRNTPSIAWSAEFIETAGATSITFVIARVTAGGSESIELIIEVDVSNPNADIFANKADLAGVVGNRAGTYVVRYLREGTVLAEGTFQLVK